MPSPSIHGLRVPLNLGPRWLGSPWRLPLNLGVDHDTPPPPPPPDPSVVGLVTSGVAARWRGLPSMHVGVAASWGGALAVGPRWVLAWSVGAPVLVGSTLRWGAPEVHARGAALAWGQSQAVVAAAAQLSWASPAWLQAQARAAWGQGRAQAARAAHPSWRSPPMHARVAALLWAGGMSAQRRLSRVVWAAPPQVTPFWRMPWGRGDGLAWVVRPPVPPAPPPAPRPVNDPLRLDLNLGCPVYTGDTRRLPLNLGITACWMARTQRRAYIVLNEISVVRLPDRLPIEVDNLSLFGGREAWGWEARVALAQPAQLAELSPTVEGPRRVEITINGYRWVVAVEAFDQSRVFGATEVTLTGRSITAQLAEPYARARTHEATVERTMVQLATAELAGSGVTLDYGTVNWLVPAGAWYYTELTPMAALQRLAEASGGVVQSHPELPQVQIRARYPVSPWDWTTTTPDVVIQDDIVTGTRLQLQSKPMFDAVIAAGERIGVAARVRRAGEAGQTYAPQQVDALITHADAARERGRNVLGDRGGQAAIEHDLPLFGGTLQPGQPGLVLPMMLAQRVSGEGTWHGLVTAVRIEVRRQAAAIDVQQTVTLERHYTDAD